MLTLKRHQYEAIIKLIRLSGNNKFIFEKKHHVQQRLKQYLKLEYRYYLLFW